MKFWHPNDKVDLDFRKMENRIFGFLSKEDLKNTALALSCTYALSRHRYSLRGILEMSKYANYELKPTTWNTALRGREKPIDVIAGAHPDCSLLIFTSYKDHLEIFKRLVLAYTNDPFHRNEVEGSPMNGAIIPRDLSFFSHQYFYLKQRMSGYATSLAQDVVSEIRKEVKRAPICVAAQSNNRKEE
ncbi:hypothetical protein LOAG_14807 [Loa loa]|uniref:Uncharacterized protein n=1 Tax=Loa loa TaxID=7209 RepID=A0A1S0TH37_LOALO|nr:hypothetical protein LOAG_14807 [Loa loa]EFO13721.1 hypothetical protein LOAG_14807 [Loa loa]